MSFKKYFCYVTLFLFLVNNCYGKNLTSYQIYEVSLEGVVNNEDEFFESYLKISPDEDIEIIHEDPIKGGVQVLVSPRTKDIFLNALKDQKIDHKIVVEDVGSLIEHSYSFRSEVLDLKGESTFERYMTYEEVESYLRMMSMKFPHKIQVKNIGKSIEGEDIPMIVITESIRRKKNKNKPVIFIEAGAHAREWVSVSVAVFLIEQLARTSTYTVDTEWHIIPVLNPDGYKYTWKDNRVWRKNRRRFLDTNCTGVDLNRNFGSYWSKAGSSSRKCSSVFRGEGPFSEPETKAMRDAVMEVQNRTKAFISFHNFGQLILYPPGGKFHKLSVERDATLEILGKKMAEGIFNVTQTKYFVGSPSKVLYPASGLSMDWAMFEAGIPLSYTFELRDEGSSGFLLPEGEIQITVEEIWAAIKILYHESKNIKLQPDRLKTSQKQPSTANHTYEIDTEEANEIAIPLFLIKTSFIEKLIELSKNISNNANNNGTFFSENKTTTELSKNITDNDNNNNETLFSENKTTTIQPDSILLSDLKEQEGSSDSVINTSTESPAITTT